MKSSALSASNEDVLKHPGPSRHMGWKGLLVGLVAVLWFSVGIWRGLTVDEYTTWDNTRKPLHALVENRFRAGHVPTFFILEYTWVRLAGDSEIALRAPSVLLAAVSASFVFLFVSSALSPYFGALVTVLYVTNQVTVWCAQNARPYAAILCAAAGIVWCLQQWFARRSRNYLFLAVIFVVLGMSFYAAFGLSVLALMCAVIVSRVPGVQKRDGVIALVIPLVLMFGPTLVLAIRQEKFTEVGTEPFQFDLRRPFFLLARVVFGDYRLWARGAMRWLNLLLFVTLFYGAWQEVSRLKNGSWKVWFDNYGLLAWLGVPLNRTRDDRNHHGLKRPKPSPISCSYFIAY
ncbi:MAG: hypothetical protein ACP5QZ_07840 [Candidatus Sumerlaeaceae bacterium]